MQRNYLNKITIYTDKNITLKNTVLKIKETMNSFPGLTLNIFFSTYLSTFVLNIILYYVQSALKITTSFSFLVQQCGILFADLAIFGSHKEYRL